jgi:hypothetical protein
MRGDLQPATHHASLPCAGTSKPTTRVRAPALGKLGCEMCVFALAHIFFQRTTTQDSVCFIQEKKKNKTKQTRLVGLRHQHGLPLNYTH